MRNPIVLTAFISFVHAFPLVAQIPIATHSEKPMGTPWIRHTIDRGSRGADGVRVADINADDLPDLTTGWEEGGQVHLVINPGPQAVKQPWPTVIVGKAESVEDAVFADLNGDARLDIVACCEGKHRCVVAFISLAEQYLWADNWRTELFPALAEKQQWMFALPQQIDGQGAVDLIVGSKGQRASVGWLQAPKENDNLAGWTWHRMTDAGWIMSLRSRDLDGDGNEDVVISDRTGAQSGCWWLKNPGIGDRQHLEWERWPIGGIGKEVMFLDLGDLDGDGLEDVVAAVSGGELVFAQRLPQAEPRWSESTIPMPPQVGTGKAVRVVDVDQDGTSDLVVTCENAKNVSGVFWMQRVAARSWKAHDISGPAEGIKFDRIELLDLDADGDLDVITCEERDNLGLIWYENPLR